VTIGDTDGDGKTDYRNSDGRVLSGPEFMSIFQGTDGKEVARTNWIARGSVSDWGDSTGNRSCRNQMGIAYFDGAHPSIHHVARGLCLSSRASVGLPGRRPVPSCGLGTTEAKGNPASRQDLVDQKLIKGHGDFVPYWGLESRPKRSSDLRILEAAQDNGVAMLDAATEPSFGERPLPAMRAGATPHT